MEDKTYISHACTMYNFCTVWWFFILVFFQLPRPRQKQLLRRRKRKVNFVCVHYQHIIFIQSVNSASSVCTVDLTYHHRRLFLLLSSENC